eukprot:g1176.t1
MNFATLLCYAAVHGGQPSRDSFDAYSRDGAQELQQEQQQEAAEAARRARQVEAAEEKTPSPTLKPTLNFFSFVNNGGKALSLNHALSLDSTPTSSKQVGLQVLNSDQASEQVDGCEMCISHYIKRAHPIKNHQCFLRKLHSKTQPYCLQGTSELYQKKHASFVRPWDTKTHQIQLLALEVALKRTGTLKDDTGEVHYTASAGLGGGG